MDNSSKFGCAGIIALSILIYALWMAVLYIGIPLALIGGFYAWKLFDRHRFDQSNKGASQRMVAFLVGGGALILGLISLSGNMLSNDGLFRSSNPNSASAPLSAEQDEANKAAANGCHDGWRERYISYEDCLAGITIRQRALEAQ